MASSPFVPQPDGAQEQGSWWPVIEFVGFGIFAAILIHDMYAIGKGQGWY